MNKKLLLGMAIAIAISACSKQAEEDKPSTTPKGEEPPMKSEAAIANPLLEPWQTPFEIPPFDKIADDNYLPAVEKGVKLLRESVDAIANNPEPPTFENTIIALEQSGQELTRVMRVFYNVTSTDTNDL